MIAASLPAPCPPLAADAADCRPAAAPAISGPARCPPSRVDEVQRGQRGYGLSVFAGTEPERFDVEVVGVMRNVSPDVSYILARLTGKGLEKSGVAGGMSGSPVFIDGRLAGAVAFSWPFSQRGDRRHHADRVDARAVGPEAPARHSASPSPQPLGHPRPAACRRTC